MIVRSNDWRGPRLAIPVMLMSIACLTTSGFSATVASESLSEVAVVADMATFEPQIRHSGVRVTISGPDGFEVVESFGADGGIAVALPGTDGLYKYELRFSQALDPLTRAQLAAARPRNLRGVPRAT